VKDASLNGASVKGSDLLANPDSFKQTSTTRNLPSIIKRTSTNSVLDSSMNQYNSVKTVQSKKDSKAETIKDYGSNRFEINNTEFNDNNGIENFSPNNAVKSLEVD
jgi:hypothetical protein